MLYVQELMRSCNDNACLPVLEAHEVVEDGVDGSAEVVKEPGDVEQVLVHPAKRLPIQNHQPSCLNSSSDP